MNVQEAQEWATKNGTMFIETSAKTKDGIAQTFEELTTKVACATAIQRASISSPRCVQILDTPALIDADAEWKAMQASNVKCPRISAPMVHSTWLLARASYVRLTTTMCLVADSSDSRSRHRQGLCMLRRCALPSLCRLR